MCRNITELRGLEPPATRQEIEAASQQFVRKVTGITKPSLALVEAMERAALEIADITEQLSVWAPRPSPATEDGSAVAAPGGARPAGSRRDARVTTAFSLTGRRALVTGASRGIGAATAAALDAAGARVALTGRSQADLDDVAASLQHDPVVIAGDLRGGSAPAEIAHAALAALGGIDILVNNAATAARLDTVDTDAALIDDLLAVNVRAPLLLIAALVPSMIEQGAGSIINLSSVSGVVGTPRRAAYAASKGALDAATRSLAIELGPAGIRVNAVAPGVVDTALWAKNKVIPGVVETIEQQTPMRRWATPDDIADVIVFLASDAARMVTGETISADGGMARTLDLYGGAV